MGPCAPPRFSIGALICAAGILLTAIPVQASAPLSALSLNSGDVQGLRPIKALYITDVLASRIDRVPLPTFTREGRILGYKTEFLRSGAASLDVQSVIVQFKNQTGATWDESRAVRNTRIKAKQSHARSYTTVKRGTRAIGARRAAISYWVTSKGRQFVVGEVHFVRGRYRATVEVIADRRYTKQSAAVAYAEGLARRVDSRVRRAR